MDRQRHRADSAGWPGQQSTSLGAAPGAGGVDGTSRLPAAFRSDVLRSGRFRLTISSSRHDGTLSPLPEKLLAWHTITMLSRHQRHHLTSVCPSGGCLRPLPSSRLSRRPELDTHPSACQAARRSTGGETRPSLSSPARWSRSRAGSNQCGRRWRGPPEPHPDRTEDVSADRDRRLRI